DPAPSVAALAAAPPAASSAGEPRSGGEVRARGGAHVLVRGLKKDFHHGGRVLPVLRGIDFELHPGEIASVVGASGAGKSTLLHVLGMLDAPSGGTITFDGVDLDVNTMSSSRLAAFRNREIGFVFQF